MRDPLTSALIGGPLDGAYMALNPTCGLLVNVADPDRPGVSHNYKIQPLGPARLTYVDTIRPKTRLKAKNMLRGGLASKHSKRGGEA